MPGQFSSHQTAGDASSYRLHRRVSTTDLAGEARRVRSGKQICTARWVAAPHRSRAMLRSLGKCETVRLVLRELNAHAFDSAAIACYGLRFGPTKWRILLLSHFFIQLLQVCPKNCVVFVCLCISMTWPSRGEACRCSRLRDVGLEAVASRVSQ